MFGTLFPPFAHLALDHPRVDPVAARGQNFLGDLRQQILIPAPQSPRTLRAFRQAAAQHLERPVNDNRRGGRLLRRAASTINTRTT